MHADQTTCSLPVNMSVPQGSVFGPLGFAVYTEDVADVISRHSVLFQLYADDTQLHASSRPDDFSCLRQRLEACVADFAQWCASRHLQLNADKTETLLVGVGAVMPRHGDWQLETAGIGGIWGRCGRVPRKRRMTLAAP